MNKNSIIQLKINNRIRKERAKKRREKIISIIHTGYYAHPSEIAERCGVDERTIRRDVNVLRDEGHNIQFNRYLQKYVELKPMENR